MNKQAQITLEACVLIMLVLAGLLAAGVYLRRAIQGHWRTNADSFSDEQYDVGASAEYVFEDRIEGSRINATNLTGQQLQEFNVTSGTGNLQINGWGTYNVTTED